MNDDDKQKALDNTLEVLANSLKKYSDKEENRALLKKTQDFINERKSRNKKASN